MKAEAPRPADALVRLPLAALPPVLDAEGLAALLHLGSAREALRLAAEGRIPVVRLSRKRLLFLTADVLEALRRWQTPALTDEDLRRRR